MKNLNETATPPHGSVLTVDELALRLRLDRKAVYDAIHRGEVPGVVRIGKVFRISAEAVDAWLKLGTAASSPAFMPQSPPRQADFSPP